MNPVDNGLASPAEFYARRNRELQIAAEKNAARRLRQSLFLAVLVLLTCVAFYESVFAKQWPVWTTLAFIPAGVWVVEQSHRCRVRATQLLSLAHFYEKGSARLARKWESLDPGDSFIEQEHFYSRDLDLFGRGSLYQLLCSARTQVACEALALWMQGPATPAEIRARQEAISELRHRRDLPELVAAAGPLSASDFRPEFIRSWATQILTRFPRWVPVAALVLALAVILQPILYWCGVLALNTMWLTLGAVLLVEVIFAGIFRGQVKAVLEPLGTLLMELPIMYELLRMMEREEFSSAKLKSLAGTLEHQGPAASVELRRLLRLIHLAKQRDNEWFAYLSFCLLWGTQFAIAIERWRVVHGGQLISWMNTLRELESLISLSTYAYEHPADTFPELVENETVFEAEGLGHPLLAENICVRNDLQLGNATRFLIVSGSNMSGKSTFLRAIGMNAVLAFMGAPVRCARLRLSRFSIGAAIRLQDSVIDGRSHFLAEMQRLRRMIEAADNEPLLFLADELMGGTNSHDRRIAAEWVIRALLLRGAIGAVTTHDLALTEIATNGLPGANVHFEDSGESGKLLFDYKLRRGVLSHSNALNIAHMLGIDRAAQER